MQCKSLFLFLLKIGIRLYGSLFLTKTACCILLVIYAYAPCLPEICDNKIAVFIKNNDIQAFSSGMPPT